jgi:hypothetical protein
MSENISVRPSAGLVDINLASEMLNPLEVLGAGAPDQAHPEQKAYESGNRRAYDCTTVRGYSINSDFGMRNVWERRAYESTKVRGYESKAECPKP